MGEETRVFEEGGGLPKAGLHTKRDINFWEKRQEFLRREVACLCRRLAFKPKETKVFEVGGGLPKAGLQTKRDTNFGEKRQEFLRREEACQGLPKAGLQTKRD